MSEFEEAREAFRVRWGFDPSPCITDALRAGEFNVEGGTEDTRAFIREMLTGEGETMTADDAPIGLHCPECGEEPAFLIGGGQQALCGSTNCRILMWDPTQTRAEMLAEGVDMGGGQR